ncbi:DUF1707 SHOCT-like domain-containing protein [Rhodococcus qingshengii]|uniref:DUF1707 SHOCT-like domain-containing protein n=1 Tax=Rhodococcus TaxID=1827 RepID=UPI001BA7E779|nr:DUF1707 domain-containing protein [Rhodococcus qingshengii]MBS3693733.1 DUF1707 domain-containing protein [Rhodococcus qingshengii]MBT2271039.1 DUF1707 domain-containing protein [Rhodococcus qingshengii]
MTRARDLDRVETCNVLDAAYAEGQLSAEDYFERTEKARSAKTLLELARLVNDLQVPKIDTTTAPRTSVTRKAVYIGGAALIVVGAVAAVAWSRSPLTPSEDITASYASTTSLAPPLPTTTLVTEPTVEPILIAHIDTLTPEGIGAFIERYREEFGDMFVDGASFHEKHSSVQRAAPGAPAQTQRISFWGGFQIEPNNTPRRSDQPTFDLGSIQIDKLTPFMENIGEFIKVPDATITAVILNANYGVPEIAIYAENGLGHQGRIEVTPWGEISRSYPYGS